MENNNKRDLSWLTCSGKGMGSAIRLPQPTRNKNPNRNDINGYRTGGGVSAGNKIS